MLIDKSDGPVYKHTNKVLRFVQDVSIILEFCPGLYVVDVIDSEVICVYAAEIEKVYPVLESTNFV